MSIGLFTDKKTRPSEAEIAAALGGALPRWTPLVAETRALPKVREEFRFMYGRNYGWALSFRLGRKFLAAFYPNAGFFTAQVILSPRQLAEVESLGLNKNAQKALDAATLYAEGKWAFVPVETDDDEADVRRLIGVKLGMSGDTTI